MKSTEGDRSNPGPCVQVFCQAAAHGTKKAHLAFFYKNDARGDTDWSAFPRVGADGRPRDWALQIVDDHGEVPDDELATRAWRHRFTVRCPLCKDAVSVTQETLNRTLDPLGRLAAEWELSLDELRSAIIASSNTS